MAYDIPSTYHLVINVHPFTIAKNSTETLVVSNPELSSWFNEKLISSISAPVHLPMEWLVSNMK